MPTSVGPLRPRYRNNILDALPAAELSRIWPHLTRVRLANGQVLHGAGERIAQVFFLEQGLTSMIAEGDRPEDVVEVGLIGPESIVGLSALFSETSMSYSRAMMQVAGVAYCLPVKELRSSLDRMPTLHRLLNRAIELSVAQGVQTAACNGRHPLQARVARWLLMAVDRVDGSELAVTHVAVSAMLAVRRPGVTLAIQALEARGLVQHARGRIRVCDRLGLENAACGCYGRLARFSERRGTEALAS